MLSPHIFLLGMLFHIKAFKAAGLDGPEKLYGLQVLKGLREQSLELRDEIQDKFVFCELVKTADGVRLDGSTALSANAARYTMRRVGEITGFSDPVTPYSLRYAAAKAFNDSREHFPHSFAEVPSRADRNVLLISRCFGAAAECDYAACE